jgi:hypothetical protein
MNILPIIVGIGFIAGGVTIIVQRKIGIGRPQPAFYLTGRKAIGAGIFVIVLGLAIAFLTVLSQQ